MMNAVLESNDAVDINLGDIFSPATQNYQNATHCFIWAPSTYKVFGKYETKAVVLVRITSADANIE